MLVLDDRPRPAVLPDQRLQLRVVHLDAQARRHADLELEGVERLKVVLLVGQERVAAGQQLLLDALDLKRPDQVALLQARGSAGGCR